MDQQQAAPQEPAQEPDEPGLVMYLEGTPQQMREMFPHGGPAVNSVYGLSCIETVALEGGRIGARLALTPIATFRPKPTIATPGGRILVPGH